MDIEKIIYNRHSVRRYLDKNIEPDKVKKLNDLIEKINKEENLNIQLIQNDKDTFAKYKLHYGKIYNCSNYIALIGPKSKSLEEKIGYNGQKIVLLAQSLGLNTCWVAAGYNKNAINARINKGEKTVCVLAIGYGSYQGRKPAGKKYDDVTNVKKAPAWFNKGVEYALLAPTAMNQQKFEVFLYENNIVEIKSKFGILVKVDLGIVKYHFELGAGKENFRWK